MTGMNIGAAQGGTVRNDVSPFKKAIKDYQDKMLTGLTEDERKEIEAKLDAYRKECIEAGMDEKAVQNACDSYYKKLLKEYGAKFAGDFDGVLACAEGEASAAQGTEGTAGAKGEETIKSKSAEAGTVNKSAIKSEMQTDPDGTVYLLITSPNGVNMKIKVGNEGDNEEGMLAGIQKAKNNAGVVDYEKNIDAYFDEKGGLSLES